MESIFETLAYPSSEGVRLRHPVQKALLLLGQEWTFTGAE